MTQLKTHAHVKYNKFNCTQFKVNKLLFIQNEISFIHFMDKIIIYYILQYFNMHILVI